MSDEHLGANSVVVQRFWHNYLSILEKARVSKSAVQWYRKHAEAYIQAHRGLRLADHLPRHIDDYLNAKGRLPAISEWQFRQITDALRLLFCELVRPGWATSYEWYQ